MASQEELEVYQAAANRIRLQLPPKATEGLPVVPEELMQYCIERLPENTPKYRLWILGILNQVPFEAPEDVQTFQKAFPALQKLHDSRDKIPEYDLMLFGVNGLEYGDLSSPEAFFEAREAAGTIRKKAMHNRSSLSSQIFSMFDLNALYDPAYFTFNEVSVRVEEINDILKMKAKKNWSIWLAKAIRFGELLRAFEGKPIPGFSDREFTVHEGQFWKKHRREHKAIKNWLNSHPDFKKEFLNNGVLTFPRGLEHYEKSISKLKALFEHMSQMCFYEPMSAVEPEGMSFTELEKRVELVDEQWANSGRTVPIEEKGEKLIEFEDGSAWFDLGVAGCHEEAKSMGHCGNLSQYGYSSQTILSYRKPSETKPGLWEPALTFILDKYNNKLGEMKGRANNKPSAKYHESIIALLKHEKIRGIVGGGYKAENNFSLAHLTQEQQEDLLNEKPELFTFDDLIKLELTGHPEYENRINDMSISDMKDYMLEEHPRFIELRDKLSFEECLSLDIVDHDGFKAELKKQVDNISWAKVEDKEYLFVDSFGDMEDLASELRLTAYENSIEMYNESSISDSIHIGFEHLSEDDLESVFCAEGFEEIHQQLCQICLSKTDEYSLEDLQSDFSVVYAVISESYELRNLVVSLAQRAYRDALDDNVYQSLLKHDISDGNLHFKCRDPDQSHPSLFSSFDLYVPRKIVEDYINNASSSELYDIFADDASDPVDLLKEYVIDESMFDLNDYSEPYYGYDSTPSDEMMKSAFKDEWDFMVSECGFEEIINRGVRTQELELTA